MAILDTITREIEKEKNLEINLPRYANEMMSLYYRYSYTRLAYNYFAMQEILQDEKDNSEFKTIMNKIDAIVEKNILSDSLGADREKAVTEINSIRDGIIASMKVLTAYADCLQIFEYILNRLDAENPENELPADYSDESFTQKLVQSIFSEKDNTVINAKIADMLGQLPVRMTRQKYFEMVRDAFSLYNDASKSSVDSFVYMLRSLTMLDKPEGFGTMYSEIYNVVEEFLGAGFENITGEQYNGYEDKLRMAADMVTELSSNYMYMQEIVNDVYAVVLAKAYAFADAGEIEYCNIILGAKDASSDEVFAALKAMEGKQEQLYENFSQYDYLIENSDKYSSIIESCMLAAVYSSLKLITKLVSTSSFIELDEMPNEETAGVEYVEKARDAFINELTVLFEGKSRRFVRSIMAATLSSLPSFIGNTDELLAYIRHSLVSCSDKVEKGVCVKLLNDVMDTYIE
ncbi:MAG: hypothetical protein E7261_04215 [Lachnospiraceae bacterium]|nr:hypothetical protein [Lachnospiraceae bacterium]